jgi:hypothetical protein
MAWKEMKRNFFRTGADRVREFDETLAAPGNSDWILVPKGKSTVSVALNPTAGSGYVEYTLSNVATVKTGSPVAVIWDAETVTTYTDDVLFKVTAMRLVNVSGTTQMVGGAYK